MEVNKLKKNKDNPRITQDSDIESLAKSIKGFPEMMKVRPIIINEKNVVLAGNTRLDAIKSLGMKNIPDEWVKKLGNVGRDKEVEFIVKDNTHKGAWNAEIIDEFYQDVDLENAGISVFDSGDDLDWDMLDDIDENEIDKMTDGLRKNVMFTLEESEYEEAKNKLEDTGREEFEKGFMDYIKHTLKTL